MNTVETEITRLLAQLGIPIDGSLNLKDVMLSLHRQGLIRDRELQRLETSLSPITAERPPSPNKIHTSHSLQHVIRSLTFDTA